MGTNKHNINMYQYEDQKQQNLLPAMDPLKHFQLDYVNAWDGHCGHKFYQFFFFMECWFYLNVIFTYYFNI